MRTTTMMALVCSTSTRHPQQRNDPKGENQQPRSVKGNSLILGDCCTKSTPSSRLKQVKYIKIYSTEKFGSWLLINYSFKAACSSSCSRSHCTKEATSPGSFFSFICLFNKLEIVLFILLLKLVGLASANVFSIILWQDFYKVAYGFIRKRPKVFIEDQTLSRPLLAFWKRWQLYFGLVLGLRHFLKASGLGEDQQFNIQLHQQHIHHDLLTNLFWKLCPWHILVINIIKCWKYRETAGLTLARWSALPACGMSGKPIWWVTFCWRDRKALC